MRFAPPFVMFFFSSEVCGWQRKFMVGE